MPGPPVELASAGADKDENEVAGKNIVLGKRGVLHLGVCAG